MTDDRHKQIRDIIERYSNCIHDSTQWFQRDEEGVRKIDLLIPELLAACNAHDELLAACKLHRELPALYEIIEYGPGGTTEEEAAYLRVKEIHAAIEAAIAKAEGA